ncbi:long-chain-fatty acid-CoA ligase protein [Trypanosoma rangeli]|uniref:Long-chain-fatty acid-CoA ligase protein n=1 Tax=Trypanosoma rangeli TaxID=5698 RepID=A0A3R7RMP5_TRYRA|nr:long-chain-fatty acid-CoA ligase protein [Trypanosoma rangeli]RNF07228.1 long-chain-fatty acid-CoA ligase protein [Trypanosoma rangeli]|eukprot:RNF07228.1 long-chain-fatty acid-CoA ligase protein [Trypanosoma rangeli]
MVGKIMNRGGITKDMARFTLGRITENRLMLKKPGHTLRTASHVLLGKFKEQFGNELRIAFIVGSQLTWDQMELLADLDVFTVGTYGALEAGGLIATDIDVPLRLKALPAVEIRVVNEKKTRLSRLGTSARCSWRPRTPCRGTLTSTSTPSR